MSLRPERVRRMKLLALAVVNVAILVAIAVVLVDRELPAPEETPPASSESTRFAIPWDNRLAPEATALDPSCKGCNLLLVSLDIFRPDHMPCFGYDKPTTPFICELVEHATVFDNFIVHAYQTPVSQMSMFTGLYPSSSGFTNFAAVLPPEVDYFPEAMKRAKYTTVAMGSSFEVMSDMSKYGSGALHFTQEGLNPGMSFGRGFDRFVFTGQRNVPTDAFAWLQEPRQDPFFLWLILGTLHWPYGAHGDPAEQGRFDPPGYDGPLRNVRQLGFEVLSSIYDGKFYRRNGGAPLTLGPADAAFINSRYDYGMWTVDQFMGELLASIPPDVLQNTLIVLHGVHGEDLGEHKYFGHYDVYDTEVRSTLIVLSPRRKQEGVRIEQQVEGVDLAPTLLDLLGLPPLSGALGTSAVEVMRTGVGDPLRLAFVQRIPLWEDIFRYRSLMPPDYVARINPILDRDVVGDTGLRTLRWKLLHRRARAIEEQVSWWTNLTGVPIQRPEWELYDLAADPTEQVNVATQEPEVTAELGEKLLAWESKVGADIPQKRVVDAALPLVTP